MSGLPDIGGYKCASRLKPTCVGASRRMGPPPGSRRRAPHGSSPWADIGQPTFCRALDRTSRRHAKTTETPANTRVSVEKTSPNKPEQARRSQKHSHSSATPLNRCRGAPSIPFLPLSIERGSGAPMGRILGNSTPGEACAPSDVGRAPLGAPPRCFITVPGPFFRAGRVLLTP